MNGLINLAFPPLNAIDALLATFLPAFLRVVVWGALAGALAMGLYWLMSNQAKIKARQERMRQIRAEIKANQDDFQKVMALSRQNLAASFGLLGTVLGPGLLSGLPVLVIIAWISTYYAYAAPPPGMPVSLTIEPADSGFAVQPPEARAEGGGLVWPAADGAARFIDRTGAIFTDLPPTPPVGVIHKPVWWNALLGNEAGYLAEAGATESVVFALERRRLVESLPGWMATWEFSFFTATIIASILLKVGFKIA